MAVTQRDDDSGIGWWMHSPEFEQRYHQWWKTFDALLNRRGIVPTAAEITAAIQDMASTLDVPNDIARGLFKRELDPAGYAAFIERRRRKH